MALQICIAFTSHNFAYYFIYKNSQRLGFKVKLIPLKIVHKCFKASTEVCKYKKCVTKNYINHMLVKKFI